MCKSLIKSTWFCNTDDQHLSEYLHRYFRLHSVAFGYFRLLSVTRRLLAPETECPRTRFPRHVKDTSNDVDISSLIL